MPSEVLIKGRDAAFFAERLAHALPALRFHAARDPAEALAKCAAADILIIRTDEIFAELIDAMPKLRLIQALTTGTDHIQALPNLPKHVVLAAARGFHGAQMSELAFIFMLHFVRDFRDLFATQDAQALEPGRAEPAGGPHRRDRRRRRDRRGAGEALQGVRHAGGRREQRPQRRRRISTRSCRARSCKEAAAQADFLIVLVPHNKETDRLIDAAVLDAMKPSGVLINIARGGVVDEDALIAALRAGTNPRRRPRRVPHRAAAEGIPALGHAERVHHLAYRRHERHLWRAGDAAAGGQPAGVRGRQAGADEIHRETLDVVAGHGAAIASA